MAVFSSPTGDFKDPGGNYHSKMAVYVVEHADPPGPSGWVCLTYYDDVTEEWTTPVFATTDPNLAIPYNCVGGGFAPNIIKSEMVSGFREGSSLYFGVMDGDVALLQNNIGSLNTFTYLYKATLTKPWYFDLQDQFQPEYPEGEFTSAGMNTPNTPDANGIPRWVHNFGINLDFTLDPVEHAVYWSRSYPYPFDVNTNVIPCDNVDACPAGAFLNPNRAQIYRQQLTPGQTFGQQLQAFFAGPWELVADVGASYGYPELDGALCSTTELVDPIQDGLSGIDLNALTFVKDTDGRIARDSAGRRAVLLTAAAVKEKVNGECDYAERSFFIWPVDSLLPNSPPVAVNDQVSTLWETPINIPFSTLLANDSDPDGHPLSVCDVGEPFYGTVDVFADSVTYTPPDGCAVQGDSFHYTLCDSLGAEDTAMVQVKIGGYICPGGGNE